MFQLFWLPPRGKASAPPLYRPPDLCYNTLDNGKVLEKRCIHAESNPAGHGRHAAAAGPRTGRRRGHGGRAQRAAGLRRGHAGRPAAVRRQRVSAFGGAADPLPRRPHSGSARSFADPGQPEPHRAADDLRPQGHRACGAGRHGAGRAAGVPGALAGRRRTIPHRHAENHPVPADPPRTLLRLSACAAPRRAVRPRKGAGCGHPDVLLENAAKGRPSAAARRSRCWVRRAAG